MSVSGDVRAGNLPTQRISWVPGLGLDLDFRVTTLSWVLGLLVTGVGALVLLYCTWYFTDRDPTLWRFTSVFTAFAGAMLGLVLTDNFLVLYVFWELTTVFSYLLIGHNPASSTNRRAAMQALIVTTFGGLAMLIGIIALGVHHTYSISALLADPPPLDAVTVAAVVLLLVGALSKSALVPFHFWLPGAMAAPTPVSAYLHAAAMVKAGIYLVALLAPVLRGRPGVARADRRPRPLHHARGRLAGLAAARHQAAPRLRHGQPARLHRRHRRPRHQGVGPVGARPRHRPRALQVDALPHRRRRRQVHRHARPASSSPGSAGGCCPCRCRRRSPALSMAGIVPLAGFVSKESALESLWEDVQTSAPLPAPWSWLAITGVVAGSALTVAYTSRFLWGAFATKPGVAADAGQGRAPRLRPGAACCSAWPASLLGLLAPPRVAVAAAVCRVVPRRAPSRSRSRCGTASPCRCCSRSCPSPSASPLFAGRDARRTRAVAACRRSSTASAASRARCGGSTAAAVETTAVTQRGSLPIYLAGILIVFVALPGAAPR